MKLSEFLSTMLRHEWILAVLVLTIPSMSPGQTKQAAINVPLVLSDGSATQTLFVGLDPGATDTLDALLGETELPPLPPSEVFDARFAGFDIGIDLGLGSLRDFRKGDVFTNGTRIHELAFQVAPGRTLTFQWAFPAGVKAVVQDIIVGTLVQFTMEGSGSFTLPNPSAFGKLKMTVQYTASVDVPETKPGKFGLYQNYPNPFNPNTIIPFELASPAQVTLEIFDTPGRKVAELVNQKCDAGFHTVLFDAHSLASGVYMYRLAAGGVVEVKRLNLLR